MHGSVLYLLEIGSRPVGGHVADFHREELGARQSDELTGRVVRSDVVTVVVPDEDGRALQAFHSLAEQRDLRDLRRRVRHRPAAGRGMGMTRQNRAPCGSASSYTRSPPCARA